MAKYKIKEPDNLGNYEQLARIAHNLRYYSKVWKEQYGARNRNLMATWENKMDEWLRANVELESEYISDQNSDVWHPQSYNTSHPKKTVNENKAI